MKPCYLQACCWMYCCLLAKLWPTLLWPHGLWPVSSVHGILQARILEWIAISFSRGSSWSRDRTQVSCIAGRRFTLWATREAQHADRWLNIEGDNAAMGQWVFSRKGVQRRIPAFIHEVTVMTEVYLVFYYRSFMHVSEVNTPRWTLIMWALMDFYITHGFISFAMGKLQNNCLHLFNVFLSWKLSYF